MDSSRRFEELARRKNKLNLISLLLAVLTMLAIVMWVIKSSDSGRPRKRYEGGMYNIGRTVRYDSVIGMTQVDPIVSTRDRFGLSLASVIEHKLVYAEYLNGEKRLPVMGYVSPAGRIVITLSYCEPCRSETFRIDGRSKDKHLVCETCSTVWRLNDLKGLYGGCVYYPPEEIPYVVEGDTIVIDAQILNDWTPREYSDSLEM